MAKLQLPYPALREGANPNSSFNWNTQWRTYEVPYPRHYISSLERSLAFEDEVLASLDLPPGYEIANRCVHQPHAPDRATWEHPLSAEHGICLSWNRMLLTLTEGEDDPVIVDGAIFADSATSITLLGREGYRYEVPYQGMIVPAGSLMWDHVGSPPTEHYTRYFDKLDCRKLFPKEAMNAFLRRMKPWDHARMSEWNKTIAGPVKGRELFDRRTTYEISYDVLFSNLVGFGVKPGLDGFTAISRPEWQWRYQEKPFHGVWANRVLIHRDEECWRFVFSLKGAGMERVGMSRLTSLHLLHHFVVVVPHSDTNGMTCAWRGLPLKVQEQINRITGMSSAMTIALNTLRGKVRALPKPMMRWHQEPVLKLGHVVTTLTSTNDVMDIKMTAGAFGKIITPTPIWDAFFMHLPANQLVAPKVVRDAPVARQRLSKRSIDL